MTQTLHSIWYALYQKNVKGIWSSFPEKDLQGTRLFACMCASLARVWKKTLQPFLLIAVVLLTAIPLMCEAIPPDTLISNTANVTFLKGGLSEDRASNAVEITSTLFFTPASLAFFQFSPSGMNAVPTLTAPTGCTLNGPTGLLTMLGNPVYPGTGTLDASLPIDLVPAATFHQGEPIFAQLVDSNRNIDRSSRDTVRVTFDVSATGDVETLEFTETGIDTGIFVGYIQSVAPAATRHDCQLAIAEDSVIRVSYVDIYDNTDTASSTTLVDPFGVIFDSVTGNPVDDATITIVDALSGLPAQVFGDDAISSFPATLTSGGTATDSSGTVYNFPPGGYRFPFMAPGNYRMEVVLPTYTAPSTKAAADLQLIPGAPFALDLLASFGNDFALTAGPPINIDIPVDPVPSALFISKSTSRTQAAIGDFIEYTVDLTNSQELVDATDVIITDILPPGFRFQAGSARLTENTIQDPEQMSDGRTLRFSIGTLTGGESVRLRYVAEVTAGTQTGTATNSVSASDATGTTSNTAQASIRIEDELLNERSFLLGRIIEGDCNYADNTETASQGVEGIRLVLEDGRYVLTDEQGMYHFEGLAPGTHVVQVDPGSLPGHLELSACEENTRIAAEPGSQFADIEGGIIWRTDFFLQRKQPLQGNIGVKLESTLNKETIEYRATLKGSTHHYRQLRLNILLADGIDYLPGSAQRGDKAVKDPAIEDNRLTFTFPDRSEADWSRQLTFSATAKPSVGGKLPTRAVLIFDTDDEKNKRTLPAENMLEINPGEHEARTLQHSAFFNTLSSTLQPQEIQAMTRFIQQLSVRRIGEDRVIFKATVYGYTDNQPIRKRSRHLFKDNKALAQARAQAVADILREVPGMREQKIIIAGKEHRPAIANNNSLEGRESNRRVNIVISVLDETAPPTGTVHQKNSGMQTVEVSRKAGESADDTSKHASVSSVIAPAIFDKNWLDQASPGLQWLSPVASFNPEIPSIEIAIKYLAGERLELVQNNQAVNPINFEGITRSTDKLHAIARWRGVDLKPGDNHFTVTTYNKVGEETGTLSQVVHYSGIPVAGELIADYSRLLADGKSPVVVAIRFHDKWGKPVRKGIVGEYKLAPPYLAKQRDDAFSQRPLSGQATSKTTYRVGDAGIALIEIEPTTESGKLTLAFDFDKNTTLHPAGNRPRTPKIKQDQEISAWLKPGVRDWILVGLAEGTLGNNSLSGNSEALDEADIDDKYFQDGRLAFYAKGRVKGEWLLTLAYDSDNQSEKLDKESSLFQSIDPDKYYTLYGDTSEQRFDAPSSEQLYVRLEREQFYAMFGDFNTGLTVTELSRYSRSMTGIKTEYEGDAYGFNAFAAETDQVFVRDEIRGNGTSGRYLLSENHLIINSEKITLETRDRFQPQRILEERKLARFVDYDIDTLNGTLFFKQPVPGKDENFNPIFIIANYEVTGSGNKKITSGGRGHLNFLDDRLELGASIIHQGDTETGGKLVGGDLRYDISDNTRLHAEIARSDTDPVNGTDSTSGNAWLAELSHREAELDTRLYYEKQDTGFGLGQQNSSDTGTERYGVDARYQASEKIQINGEAYRDKVLATNANRDVAAASVEYHAATMVLSSGLVYAKDNTANGKINKSTLLTADASRRFLDNRLNLHIGTELALDDAESVDFPTRTILGADFRINPAIELFAEQEFTNGDTFDSQATRLGFRSIPWHMATINSSLEQQAAENGQRLFSNLGLTQGFVINEYMQFDFGIDRTQTLQGSDANPFNTDVPLSSGLVDGDYTAVFIGGSYNRERWSATSRLEYRDGENDSQRGLFIGLYREHSPGLGLSLGSRILDTTAVSGNDTLSAETRFSVAYRPPGSRWIVLNRLDMDIEHTEGTGSSIRNRKIVNNMSLNYLPDRRNQLALHHGIKFGRDSIDGDAYTGVTQVIGVEYLHDINSRWDIGFHGNALYSGNSNNYRYSIGPVLGASLLRNLWVSAGYNVAGFEDDDFSTAGYTAEGPYIKLRFKFGTQTIKDLVSRLDK